MSEEPKKRKRSTPGEMAHRIAKVAEMRLNGMKLKAIGKVFGVSENQAWLDWQAAQRIWRTDAVRNVEELRLIELTKIDETERKADLSFEQTGGTHTITRNEAGSMVNGAIDKTVKTSEKRSGDPRYLDIILRCIDRRCKLLGLDPPVKADLTFGFRLEDLLDDPTPVEGERIDDTPADPPQPPQIEAKPNGSGHN